MSTTHFFLLLRGAGRWRRAAQEIHSTAGGARAKAAGKAAPAQNRRGSSCWSRKSRCCGLGTLRDCSLAAASVACSALALTNAALAKPTATVALANPVIVIAASVVSQSAAAVALAATAVALSPPPGHHHRHRHRPRRHGLRHPLPARRRRRLRLRLRRCRHCPKPAQSASAALASLATVEGRGASLIRSRLIETVRSVCGTSWFSLRLWLKAPHKRQIFSRGCRPAHPAVGHVQRFSLHQLFQVHILGARLNANPKSESWQAGVCVCGALVSSIYKAVTLIYCSLVSSQVYPHTALGTRSHDYR